MQKRERDFYKDLRKKIRTWAATPKGRENQWMSLVMAAPDLFHLLCRLSFDPDVPAEHKVKL